LTSDNGVVDRNRVDWLDLLRKHNIRPVKRLGQNFLTDPKYLRQVVQAAQLSGSETVLEVGAGIGTLTLALAPQCNRLIALEFDERLLPALDEVVSGFGNVQVVVGDILEVDLHQLLSGRSYCVVANIPYNITSALFRRLIEDRHPPLWMVLTVQREVAQRIVAESGSMSLLALSVQLYGNPRIVARIPPQAFHPHPKVASAILRVELTSQPAAPPQLIEPIFRLARAGFSQRRKKLRNALAGGLHTSPAKVLDWITSAGLHPNARAQELGVEEWACLAKAMIQDREA
jgi:16S rRNA (adenine1518-N6/adenine1519-N6)-dimethyltransferase